MVKECLFYNGELGFYEVLDFNPNGVSKKQLKEKILKALDEKGISGKDADKALETVYLIDIENLEKAI